MFQKLEMFKTAMSMARHAGMKQAFTSRNIANADTPGYRAYRIQEFSEFHPAQNTDVKLRNTRPQHFSAPEDTLLNAETVRTGSEPNKNSVVLANEILSSVDAKRQHDRALAIYKSSLDMLRSTLSKQ